MVLELLDTFWEVGGATVYKTLFCDNLSVVLEIPIKACYPFYPSTSGVLRVLVKAAPQSSDRINPIQSATVERTGRGQIWSVVIQSAGKDQIQYNHETTRTRDQRIKKEGKSLGRAVKKKNDVIRPAPYVKTCESKGPRPKQAETSQDPDVSCSWFIIPIIAIVIALERVLFTAAFAQRKLGPKFWSFFLFIWPKCFRGSPKFWVAKK